MQPWILHGALLLATFSIHYVTAVRHIVFIVADDLGWNDVGFHNPDMITPNIDKLASGGIILNSSYVQPVCTPSRHSFMSGVYPFKAGLQRGAYLPYQAGCSPLELEYLPEKLKTLNYATHMIGKWHLGFCNWNCTPTYRGFDSFLGFYNGQEDYYSKVLIGGKDYRDGVKPAMNTTYSAEVFADRAIDIINNHDKNTPLFLYLPFQSVHIPIQVPKRYEEMYPNIKNDQRRQYCGMVSAMDEGIGNITKALENAGLMEDTLIIFTADNGGWPAHGGNNFPLRGSKLTIYEGGTRAAAFVYGAGLEKTGYIYDGLIHAVDWNPTIVAAAGGKTTSKMDGVNQWDAIRTGGESQRTELVYNLDNAIVAVNGHAAIRVGDFKLIQGYPGPYPDWYPLPETDSEYHNDNSTMDESYEKISTEFAKNNRELLFCEELYNLRDDPTERTDISKKFPGVVKRLNKKLDEYRKSLVPPPDLPVDPKSFPFHYDGYWSPGWC